ncbi:hypothetical protein V5799_029200 [Amblyomma americanum]|uniref:Uncharacterized protein n=1 Tax=Amblyomma americanum TaxID=6943 RepID=A0AAQ4ES22_AMBAM
MEDLRGLRGTVKTQVRAFIREHVKERALAKGCAATLVSFYDFMLQYFFLEQSPAHRNIIKIFEPETEEHLMRFISMLMSGCDTHRLARTASQRGCHYITDGVGKTLFEPVLDTEAVAAFITNGTTPNLRSGKPWPSVKFNGSTRVLFANNTETLDTRLVSEACQDAFFPSGKDSTGFTT